MVFFKQKFLSHSSNNKNCSKMAIQHNNNKKYYSNKAIQHNNYKKNTFLFYFAIILIFIFFFSSNNSSYCFTPKIVNKLSQAFEDIEDWLIKLSTPAAAVAVGVGLFMKKFSFGDEERIRMSKKIIRGSLVSYALLLAVNLILAAIKSLID